VTRLVWVGLAALLPDADGVPLMDTEGYPQQFRSFYLAHAAALDVLSASDLDWTAVSPSGDFDHGGVPVGGYRVAPADAASLITYTDHAIALVDEAERPHSRRVHLGVATSTEESARGGA
jgi:putative NADH-flavin reductase